MALEVADLVAGERELPESRSVAAALAVLAGIAASDAACCAALGRRARGDDHRQAAALLGEIADGDRAAKTLLDLLNLKDTAQDGLIPNHRAGAHKRASPGHDAPRPRSRDPPAVAANSR